MVHNFPTCNTLVYEGGHGGHRIEYIEYLLIYLQDNPELKNQYVFLLNSKLAEELTLDSMYFDGIELIKLDIPESNNSLLKRSFQEWKLIKPVLQRYPNISSIIFMNLDMFQYVAMSPGFRKLKFQVKGILFQPYVQLPNVERWNVDAFKLSLRKFRKKCTLLSLTALNKNLTVFVLNDEKGVERLNKTLSKSRLKTFEYLPDPIDDRNILTYDTKPEICERYRIDLHRKILLVFGRVDERKNVIRILQAIAELPDNVQENVALLICGNINPGLQKSIYSLRELILNQYPELQIVISENFVSILEREKLFKGCDIVLMPYLNFYGSSGVLGHSIKYSKAVIRSAMGLMVSCSTRTDNVTTVNPLSVTGIAEEIQRIIEHKDIYSQHQSEFIVKHSPSSFSSRILVRI